MRLVSDFRSQAQETRNAERLEVELLNPHDGINQKPWNHEPQPAVRELELQGDRIRLFRRQQLDRFDRRGFRPVQIDGHTYVDGGVRSSVFEAGVGRRLSRFTAKTASAAPHIYVMRNGPTIVFRDANDPGKPGVAAVDARPDIMRVGMRAYSTLVNQNELMSIASLRLNYPRGPISVISADGFNAPMNPKPCGPRPEALFEARFMHCLIDWGAYKARFGPGWISLRELDAARSADPTGISK